MPAQEGRCAVSDAVSESPDVLVVGGGIIGAAIAWRLVERGLDVTIADANPNRGAWHTAAGMLAPVTELHYGEQKLLDLNLASARRYPDFVASLGVDVGYTQTGTVVTAWDAADMAALRDLHALHRSLGLRSEPLTAADVRALEPGVAPGLPGGLFAADDHAVDPRRLHAALVRDVKWLPRNAIELRRGRHVVLDNGDVTTAGTVVLAAGAWTGRIDGVTVDGLRPVKGQTIRLRTRQPVLSHVLRGSVRGVPVYVLQRADGEIVVGATSEDAGFDLRPRAGAVYELLRDAQRLLPVVEELELVEISTGLRPGTPDNMPIVDEVDDGVIVATGHFRNGVLLAPITADTVAAMVTKSAVTAQ